MFNTARLQKLSRLRAVSEIPLATRRQLLRQALPGECEALPGGLVTLLRDTDAALIGVVVRRLLDFSTTDIALVNALADRLIALQSSSGAWSSGDAAGESAHDDAAGSTILTAAALAGLTRLLDEPHLEQPAEAARYAEVRHAVEAGFAALAALQEDPVVAGALTPRAWVLRLLAEAPESRRFLPMDRLRREVAAGALAPSEEASEVTADFLTHCLDHAAAHAEHTSHTLESQTLEPVTDAQQDVIGFLIAQVSAA